MQRNKDLQVFDEIIHEYLCSSARSRWWFMAISTCGEGFTPMKGIRLEYRLVMTNGEPTDIFTYQFSFDQRCE